jgi:MFS transporter, DHA1 family, tetracycline resistance protein
MEKYHYTVGQLGVFVGFIGVIFALMSSIGVRFVLKLFSNETITFTFFILMMAIANIGAAVSQGEMSQWLWVILNAAGDVICFTTSLAIFSNLADKEAQGWIMGVTGAIGAMTWTVGGIIAGPLGYINISVPFWVAGGLCLISFILIIIYQRIHKIKIK